MSYGSGQTGTFQLEDVFPLSAAVGCFVGTSVTGDWLGDIVDKTGDLLGLFDVAVAFGALVGTNVNRPVAGELLGINVNLPVT